MRVRYIYHWINTSAWQTLFVQNWQFRKQMMTVLGFIKTDKDKAKTHSKSYFINKTAQADTCGTHCTSDPDSPRLGASRRKRKCLSHSCLPGVPPTRKHTDSTVWFLTLSSSNVWLIQTLDSMFWIQNSSISLLHCLEHADNLVMGRWAFSQGDVLIYSGTLI